MTIQQKKPITYRREIYQRAIVESFVKLNPRWMVRNPVMFVVEVGSVLTTALWIQALAGKGEAPAGFIGAVALWLWFPVPFAHFAPAVCAGASVAGMASVDESAVTGESAPVIREAGGDRSAVTGGTRVLSDWLIIRVTTNPGEGFLEPMIELVEGAKRQKTPNEIALNILLAGFTIIFLVVCATLLPYSLYSVQAAGEGVPVTLTVPVGL